MVARSTIWTLICELDVNWLVEKIETTFQAKFCQVILWQHDYAFDIALLIRKECAKTNIRFILMGA